MTKRTVMIGVGLGGMLTAQALSGARRDRDRGDVAALRALATKAEARAAHSKTAAAYLEAAKLEAWLTEAGRDRQQDAVVKAAAEAGAQAAKQAIALDPKSSEAYRLRGSLLGQVISTGGMFAGMRYGAESTQDLEKAIQLDPKSARAYVARAIGYLYTPDAFGGSKPKAVATLQKAEAIAPNLDTVHIWLAQAYVATKQPQPALREAREAVRLNPDRMFAQYVLKQAEKGK